MKLSSKITVVLIGLLLISLSGSTFASIGQIIKYNFKATAESSISGREDVVHPSDDASQSEVVVTTGGWSLITVTGGWSPIFGATAFAANGETVSDSGAMLLPYAEYGLQSSFPNGLPLYQDYTAEFFLTGIYFPTRQTNGISDFDTGVFHSNWITQVVFNPTVPPSANMMLTGLNPAKVYNFKIIGSLDDAAAGFLVGTTVYAVGSPQNNIMVNTKGNTSHYATFAGVVPNASGEISLRANAAWNPGGYIGMLGGVEVIESDMTDVPSIFFASDTLTILPPATSTTLVAGTSVGGGASIKEHRWRQVKGPIQATIVSQTGTTTDITGLTVLGVYEFELSVFADNGIESRKTLRVVVDSGNWTKRIIINVNPLANDGQDIEYIEYLPDDYNNTGFENKRYPVIIYLHGFGQNGRDTEMLKGEGLGYLVDQGLTNLQFTGTSGKLEKFIAIIPQLSTAGAWDSDDIDAVIAHVLSGTQYRADYNKIYIDGFSYGSLGLWNYLATPNKADAFAAAVPVAYVPTWGPQYCNASGVEIFAMSEADMIGAGYYISSPDDFTGFMQNLSLCPMSPPVIGQVMTGRDHVEMYNFHWQTNYTGFEGGNIYEWFLKHERNYASGGAGQSGFVFTPGIDVILSPGVQTVLSGGTATFNLTIVNTGDSDLTGLVITSSSPNCTLNIQFLAQGASTGFSCNETSINAPMVNTVYASGYAYSGGISYMSNSANDSGSASVNIATFIPALQIIQTPPIINLQSGDNASIFLVITNTGDVDLSGVVVVNPTMPACNTTIGYLAKGASTGYNCTLNSVIASFTSTTYTSGYAYSGGSLLLAYPTSANASSDIIVTATPSYNPALQIIQTPPTQTISSVSDATIFLVITNTGDVDLSGVVLANPTMPACNTTIGYLAKGASTGYSCTKSFVVASFTTTTYVSGYAYSGGSLLLAYPTSANASSDIIVSGIITAFNPLIRINITPSSQTITSGGNATFTVSVINSGDSNLSGVNVYNPTVPGCNIVIGYLPIGAVAGYSCQTNTLTTSFVTTMYTSGYVYSGSVSYTGTTTSDVDSVTVTVNPIIITPPPPPHGGFGGGGMGTYYNPNITTLSNLPQIQPTTTLSNIPKVKPKPVIQPTVIIEYPAGTTTTNPPFMGQGGQSYLASSNGSADYKLPYASLRQLLESLVQ